MSTLAKLDLVLNTIAANSHPLHASPDISHQSLWNNLTDNGNNNAYILDFELILEKLINEKYININVRKVIEVLAKGENSYDVTYYHISFEGRYFLEYPGGYVNQKEFQDLQKQEIIDEKALRKKNDRRLIVGTFLVAAGAIGLIIWEIVKTLCIEAHRCGIYFH